MKTTDLSNYKNKNSPLEEGLGEVNSNLAKPYNTANPKTYAFIKEMRDYLKNNPTRAENIMWEYLKNQKIGYKIRRQHIIDNFIADFICLSSQTVIEIDGKIHEKQKEYDALRTERLNQLGFEIIRFTNLEVFENPKKIADCIQQHINQKNHAC